MLLDSNENLVSEHESVQKKLVSSFIGPILTVMSVLYYIAYLEFSAEKVTVMLFGFCVTGLNIFFTGKNRTLSLGKFRIETKSDFANLIRWIFNLAIADVILIHVFTPDPAGIFGFWSLILLSANADLFRKKYKNFILVLGWLIGSTLLILHAPEARVSELVFFSFCLLGIVLIFTITENLWLQALDERNKKEAEIKEMEATEKVLSAQVEQLEVEARIGEAVRSVAHEYNNCLTVLNVVLRKKSINDEALTRTVDKLNKINLLILEDYCGQNAKKRAYFFHELANDCEVLISKLVMSRGVCHWNLTVAEDLKNSRFMERQGSIFFIIMNLVKNSTEAIARGGKGYGNIKVDMYRSGKDAVIEVIDDGPGIPDTIVESVLSLQRHEYSSGGHGLGLRFCMRECQKNDFGFDIISSPSQGTRFRITLAIHVDEI